MFIFYCCQTSLRFNLLHSLKKLLTLGYHTHTHTHTKLLFITLKIYTNEMDAIS
jgi:hypothetical protein